jgi:hypothetical protein
MNIYSRILKIVAVLALCFAARAQVPNSFGLYLTVEAIDTSSSDSRKTDLARIALEQSPLITEKDIEVFDLVNLVITLKPEALKRIHRPPVRGRSFVVIARGERVFLGALWTILSSFGPAVPTICVDGPRPTNSFRLSPRDLAAWSDPRIRASLPQQDKPTK